MNIKIGAPAGGMAEETIVTMFFNMDKRIEFERAEDNVLIPNHIQIMLMICSTASDLEGGKMEQTVVSGEVEDFKMNVYYA